MTIELLRVLLAPALVVASSLAGRRWGASVSGVLVGLPIVAGPILLVTSLQNGSTFGARSAGSALLGLVSLALFAVVFAHASRRAGWLGGLGAGWGLCLVADALLAQVRLAPALGLVVAVAATLVAARLMPAPGERSAAVPRWPWWDLPARAVATASLVVVLTTLSVTLGPAATGVLAPFPIATSVVAAFVCAQADDEAVRGTLAGVLRGLVGFAVFCFCVAVLVEPAGVVVAFGAAAAGAVATQAVVAAALRRRLA